MHSHFITPYDACCCEMRPVCCAPCLVTPAYAMLRCDLLRKEACPPPCPAPCPPPKPQWQQDTTVQLPFCLPRCSSIREVCVDVCDVRCACGCLQVRLRATVCYADRCGCECRCVHDYCRRVPVCGWQGCTPPCVEVQGKPQISGCGSRWSATVCLHMH